MRVVVVGSYIAADRSDLLDADVAEIVVPIDWPPID